MKKTGKVDGRVTHGQDARVTFGVSVIRVCFGFRVSCFGFIALALVGCGNPVLDHPPVSQQELRTVDTLHLEPSAEQPTTLPSERVSATAPAATQPSVPQVELAIEQARAYALANNLDIQVSLVSPSISRTAISEAEAQYESLFTTNAAYANRDAATATELEGSQTQNYSVNPEIQIPLRTGGQISLGFPIDQNETNNEFATLNPSWDAEARASITQPLLRNAGIDVNLRSIKLASYNYLSAEAQTKLQVIQVLTDVDRAYWRLYAARQALVVRKKEYDLAMTQLDRARRQVDAGVAAEVEVVRAESGVADTQESIINAENLVRNTERDLKRIMNQPDLDIQSLAVVVPVTTPRTLYYRVNAERIVAQAIAGRMEMLEQELLILEDAVNVSFARNQLLPALAISYTYGVPGLGGSFNDAVAQVGDNTFNNHTLSLQLEVPIGNEAARAGLRRALLVRMQNLLTKELRALTIKQETLNAIDRLNTNWYRIIAARKRVDAASRVYEAEVRQFNQGLRTSTDVIIAQNNLANAALSELAAIADYQISQTDIAQATGTVLGQTKVGWTPAPQPAPK